MAIAFISQGKIIPNVILSCMKWEVSVRQHYSTVCRIVLILRKWLGHCRFSEIRGKKWHEKSSLVLDTMSDNCKCITDHRTDFAFYYPNVLQTLFANKQTT